MMHCKDYIKWIAVALLVAVSGAFVSAQTPADSTVDKNTVKKMIHWVSVFTMYSDLDLSDKVDLAEYADAADIASGFVTNPELSVKLAEFRAATFVNVYPKGMIGGDQWITNKLNEISEAQYSTLNAPYLSLEVWFTPIDANSGYLAHVMLEPGAEISEDVVGIQRQINEQLTGKSFASPRTAKQTVNEAIFRGLDELQTLLGSRYAPNIAIRFDDHLYVNGNTLETWQRADGLIQLEAVDREGNLLTDNLTWTGVRGGGNPVEFLINEVRTDYVTLRRGDDQIRVMVRVKEFNLNVEDLLKELLLEVVGEKLQEARQDIEKIKVDSAQAVRDITTNRAQLDSRLGITHARNILSEFEPEPLDDVRSGTVSELERLRNDPVTNDYIESNRLRLYLIAEALLQIKIESFLRSIIADETNINVYVLAIKDNSPDLIADLIVNLVRRPENRTQIKDLVIAFLNKQIDEVASRS
ncbi:MAG: hypothetical protein AB7O48_19630 [Cyclobacteriaceae bacterium]